MISESIKKKLDTLKSPENSQTNQSGFSASGMDKLTALKEELNRPVTPYEPKFDESLVESGKTKYESDKSQFQSAYGKWNRNVMGIASANWGKTGKAVEGLPDNRTGWEGVNDRYIADMDEDTLKSFYTLYDKDADSAIDFASEYQRLKAEQKAVENAQKTDETFKNLGLINDDMPESAQKIAKNVAKTMIGIGGMAFTPIDAASALIDYSAGGGNFSEDVKAGNAMPFTQMSSQFQNEVRQAIAQDAKWAETKEGGFFREKLGIENFATAMFDVGYSSAQSALIMKTFGPAGLALFGTSAFSSSLQENLARDENGEPLMDDGTVLAKATIAGALEAITEEVSLEYVLKAKDSKGILTKIRNLIFAGLAEGSEELASEVGNYVTDALLRADESDFAKAKAKYLAYGEDDDTAAWHAILEFMPEAAYSTLSGFFSGLLMQGGAMSLQDVAANAGARSTIAESKASGEYADLIEGLNASDYMEGKTPLTESSKKRDVVKAYRGATESIEQASIKDRLMEETTYAFENDAEATAKAIYDKANDYTLSAAQKRLLNSQTAQKVLTEYTEGKKKSGTHEWVDRAVLSQQYATRSTKGESMFSETELGRELRESEKSKAELSARESALKVVSEQIGIDVKTLASQNINMPVETYENNLELAYSYGRAGYKLEDVARKLGTDVSGIFGEAYQKGLEAYKSRSTEKSLRTKLGGKVNIVSQSELDKLNTRAIKETGQNPNYTEVNLSEMKKNNPMVYSAMEMVAKVYAPSVGRQVNFFSAENGVNGWRDASGIWINTDGVFEAYGKKGNVLGFFVHEFGHDLRADAPELFEEARKIIIDSAYKGNADALTKAAEGIILERGGDTKVDLEGAVEELVCDGLVKLTEDKEMLDKAFRTENLNFWKRFKNFLDKLVANFKKFLNTFTGANETARLLDVDAVQKLADVVGKYVDRIQAETKSSKSTETSTENKSETKQSITHKAITYEEVKKARDDYNDARIAYSKLEADYNDRVRKIMSNGKSMDEQVPEIAAEEKRLGVDKAKKALDETRKKYETTEKAYAEQQLKIEKEKERAAIEKSGLSEADYFRKLAKKEFGLTGNFRIAGYMLPSGSMLNFGAGSTTIRGEDHRRIGTIYTSDVTAEIASAGMLKFMNDGNIRVMAETPGVDISSKVEPTAQQYANIKRMAASLGKEEGYFSVDFTDTESKYGDVVGVLEYDNNINPERIVNDIKHYYATGEVRVPSTVGKFYSVPHIGLSNHADVVKASDETLVKEYDYLVSQIKRSKRNFSKESALEPYNLIQDIVYEYAGRRGYTSHLYHGSPTFGFTKIDMSRSDDKMSFFATDDTDMASTYSGVFDTKQLNSVQRDPDKMSFKDIANIHQQLERRYGQIGDFVFANQYKNRSDYYSPAFKAAQSNISSILLDAGNIFDSEERAALTRFIDADPRMLTLDDIDNIYQMLKSKSGLTWSLRDSVENSFPRILNIRYARNEGYEVFNNRVFNKDLLVGIIRATYGAHGEKLPIPGNYELLARTDGFMEVYAEGNYWNQIPTPKEMSTVTSKRRVNTRAIARFAHDNDYPGVIIQAVTDSGGRTRADAFGDVYIFFNPNDVKSADLIVYDDKRKVIPLDQRFDSTQNELRYSVPHTDAAPTFYSQMGKVIESKNQTKFEARSLINMLLGNGVKADEIKWSGIATFLEGKKSVSKEDLIDFVNKSKLQIEETWLGKGEWNESPELLEAARENVRQSALENLQNQFEIGMLKNLSKAINTMRIDYENGAFMVTAELDGNEITFFKENPRINVARWGDREYNLSPYNYRELLFRLPGATYTNKAMKVHWGEDASGILSHARIDDAWLAEPPTDPNTGEAYPMLFIEEIQSDWDNARYRKEAAIKFYRALTGLMKESEKPVSSPGTAFVNAQQRFESIAKKLEQYAGLRAIADPTALVDSLDAPYRLEDSHGDVLIESDKEADIYDAIRAAFEIDIMNVGEIPDAPYGDGKYVEYTLKKLLRTAAEEGYTKIGWTTGKQQEERWSDEYAEAYRIEYDQQMPKFLNKYGKQWGATVSQEKLDNGQMVWTFPITEAMRKSVMEIGQPLYSVKHRASSRMGVAMSNGIRDSIKHIDEFSLSPRQYLAAAALETIRDPADREELRKIIDEYQTLDDTKTDLEHQIAKLLIRQDELNADLQEIQQTLSKTSAAKSRIVTDLINRYGSTREAMSTIRTELKDIEKQLKNLRSEQGKVTARLHDILTMPRVESIIEEQRQLVREYRNLYHSTKEADKIKLQELRERMNQKLRAEIDKRIEMRKKMVADYNERKKIDYYMPRIEATLKDLNKHLAKAPMPFRGPVLQFISMLDFRQRDKEGNVRLTRKSGDEVVPHQANLERERRLAEIEALLGKDEESYGDIEKWFQTYGIPLDDDLKRYITNVRNFLKNFVAANMVPVNMRAEDAAEIKSVYQFAKMLDRMLVIAAKGYTDVALDQSKNSREIAEHIEPLERKNTKVSKLESFMSVDNAQPETIFDRLGEGGKKLFNILANGADRYAINRQIISDFAADWDKKQVREWQNPKELVSVPFTTVDDEGNETVENVPMTPAQMMTLYATLQDPDGWRHIIDGEGFQLDRIKIGADGKKGEQVDTTRKMTEKDYNALVEKMNAYDPDLIPFADKLHKFISDQGREWGNQVSIGRYGFEQFTQPKYFPLFTVEKGKSNTIDAIYSAMRQSFYGLLNRSFTKERLPNAINALIIGDFFDIFIEHMSDMALYNAYALPVLEVNRFLNYVEYDVEKDEKGNEHLVEQWKMKDKLDKAFGTDIIENYIKNVFDSINGQEYLSRSDSLFLMGLKLRNRVAVTANVRVIVQQFFSIIRAGEVIPSKYLLQGGYNFKETRDEMYRYAPVANWKRQGNYNTDIKLPLKEELIGAETGYKRFVNAVSEYGMTPAEFMDEVAWTRIWHGVTEWVKNTNPGLSDEAFYDECNKRFRDIIYRTQVVDSVLQKSQFMRQQTFQARVLSSFKGEPTTSYNQLLRVVDMYKDAKQRGDLKTAWATIRPLALRAITAYCLNAIANAVVTSLVDMIRDDDDYETMWEKFIEALFGEYRKNTRFWRDNMTFGERVGAFTRWFQSLLRSNLVESFNPLDIPLLSDIFSLLQGYDADRADLMIAEQAFDLMGGIIKSVDGIDTKLVYDLVGAVSQLFGLPVQNVMRDSLATWNSVVGIWNELFGTTLNMKVQITPESAQSGYEALYDAMSKGKESRALELVTEIMDNVKDSDKAYTGITAQIRDAYKHNEITAEQAHDYLIAAYSYFDVHKKSYDTPAKLDKHIKDQVSGWDK